MEVGRGGRGGGAAGGPLCPVLQLAAAAAVGRVVARGLFVAKCCAAFEVTAAPFPSLPLLLLLTWHSNADIACRCLPCPWRSMNTTHFDIKSANILLTRELTPKLADVGLARCVATLAAVARRLAGIISWRPCCCGVLSGQLAAVSRLSPAAVACLSMVSTIQFLSAGGRQQNGKPSIHGLVAHIPCRQE